MGIELQLRAIASGDRGAFATVFRAYQMPFVRYATGLLAGDREAAEDVVDEAFLAVWQQAGRFDGRGSGEGWMRRIVRNKAIDWLRKCHEVPMTEQVEAVCANEHDGGQSPFDHAVQSAAAVHLRASLSALSTDQREAVWLCYFEERSLAEIAEIAECPENTVKTRLFHARKILRNSGLLESAVSA